MENVETDIELVFNEDSTEPLPENTDVVQTLVTAVSNPNSGFNLTVDSESIVVTSEKMFLLVRLLTVVFMI